MPATPSRKVDKGISKKADKVDFLPPELLSCTRLFKVKRKDLHCKTPLSSAELMEAHGSVNSVK